MKEKLHWTFLPSSENFLLYLSLLFFSDLSTNQTVCYMHICHSFGELIILILDKKLKPDFTASPVLPLEIVDYCRKIV